MPCAPGASQSWIGPVGPIPGTCEGGPLCKAAAEWLRWNVGNKGCGTDLYPLFPPKLLRFIFGKSIGFGPIPLGARGVLQPLPLEPPPSTQ